MIDRYRWRTMSDEAVCSDCAILDMMLFVGYTPSQIFEQHGHGVDEEHERACRCVLEDVSLELWVMRDD